MRALNPSPSQTACTTTRAYLSLRAPGYLSVTPSDCISGHGGILGKVSCPIWSCVLVNDRNFTVVSIEIADDISADQFNDPILSSIVLGRR
jgi:hypothetical protein